MIMKQLFLGQHFIFVNWKSNQVTGDTTGVYLIRARSQRNTLMLYSY